MSHQQLEQIAKLVNAAEHNKIQLYTPHEKQRELHRMGNHVMFRAFFAGNRVGKTYSGCMEDTYHLTGNYPTWWEGKRFKKPITLVAASVSSVATRDILQSTLLGDKGIGTGTIPKELIDLQSMVKIPNGTGAVDNILIKHASGGWSKLLFKSYEQGREKMQGFTADFIHLDEEPPWDIYTELATRTATVRGCIMLTMTPLSGMTPLMEHFIEKQPKGHAYINASWEDNPYLDEDVKENLRAAYAPHELEARTKGIPSIGEGKVYPVTEESIKFTPTGFPSQFVHFYGMDFGWHDTSVVVCAYDPDTDIMYLYDCYKEGARHGTERTPAEHVANFPPIVRHVSGVCDPSGGGTSQADGQRAIEQYQELLDVTRAKNAIEPGINEVLQRMKSGRFKVADTPNMDKWWKEFRKYARIRNKAGTGYKFNADDHLMDATRYLVYSGVEECTATSALDNFYQNEYEDNLDWTLL